MKLMLNNKIHLKDEKGIVFLVILSAFLLRIIFMLEIPAWQSPDEYPHYWVIEKIANDNSLPDTDPDFPAYEAFQPPLYYIFASVIVKMSREEIAFSLDYTKPPMLLIAIRFLSVIAGVLVLIFLYLLVNEIPELNRYDRIASVAFAAFLPTFVGVTATVNNDAFAILFSTISLFYILKPVWNNKMALKAGFWAALALCTKLSTIILLPIIVLRFVFLEKSCIYSRVKWGFLSIGTWAIGAFIFITRNVIQFDAIIKSDPGYDASFSFSVSFMIWALRNLMWSFWLAFGRVYDIVLYPNVYLIVLIPLFFLAGLGIIRYYRDHANLVLFLSISILISIVSSLYYTFSYPPGTTTSWGKNLYPVLPLIAILFNIGWNSVHRKCKGVIMSIVTIFMLLGCFWVLVIVQSLKS